MDKRRPLLYLIPLTPLLFIFNDGIPIIILMWAIYFIYCRYGIKCVSKRDENGKPTGEKMIVFSESTMRGSKWYSPVDGEFERSRKMTDHRRENNSWRGKLIKDENGNLYSDDVLKKHEGDPFWEEFGEF